MHQFLSSCRIVQLENPYEQWSDPLVRELFEKTTTLKFEGYKRKYPNGVIPTDASTWFGDHFLVCQESSGLQPIMGFQRTSLERYRKHYRPFSPLAMCEESGDARHIAEMKKLVSHFDTRPDKLSYTGSFTIDPELRTDRKLVEELLQFMVVLHYLFHQEEGEGHEIITGAATRFKIDASLMPYGFFPLLDSNGGTEKDTLTISFAAGEETRVLRLREFNRKMDQLAEPYVSMWEKRMVLRKETNAQLVTNVK